MNKILVVHGPNLNMLGVRETGYYGKQSLAELDNELQDFAANLNLSLQIVQSNSEGYLIDAIHQAVGSVDFIIINPAAFTHTSIALRDALVAVAIPFIEVHISNIYAREAFRQQSYFSDVALGVISGFGLAGYSMALQAVANISKRERV